MTYSLTHHCQLFLSILIHGLSSQVTTLQDNISGQYRQKRLRNVYKLIQIVDKATENFNAVAENIATENPEFQVIENI